MNMESNDIFSVSEKRALIWQSRFKVVLLQVAFYVKA